MLRKTPAAVLGAGVLLAALPWLRLPAFYESFLYLALFWIVLATSWNILSGYSGYFSFGHGAFFGAGVYTTATLAGKFDWPFLLTLPVAAIVAAAIGVGVGAVAFRVRGVRGEVFWLQAPGLDLRRPVRLLHVRHRVYLVPRAPDLVVVGASEIESEDRLPVSLRTTVELLAAAHSVVPALAEARVVHTETNLRPALPDNQPLLEKRPGLVRINGLFRHGWLIAPALVEEALQGLSA